MATPTSTNEQPPQSVSIDQPLTKEELERKKLLLEIKDLERPFWKRPAYVLAALPTFLGVVALTIGFVNGFFSAQLTKLENQKHDLEAQIREFENTKSALVSQNEQFRQELVKRQEGLGRIREILVQVQETAKIMENITLRGKTREDGGIEIRNKNPDPMKIMLLELIQPKLNKLLSEMAAIAGEDKKR